MTKKFRSFQEAREYVHSLKLKSVHEWENLSKSGKKPKDIPYTPVRTYPKQWKGFGDWLGTGNVAPHNMEFMPFGKARDSVQKLNLQSLREWKKYSKSGKRPDDIPSNPNSTYKNKGWISMGDWLGTGTIAPQNKKYRSFVDAKEFVQQLNLKTRTEWVEYCFSGKKPDDIPANLVGVYKKHGWKSIGNFLGTGRIANQNRKFKSFEMAKQFVHSLKLKSKDDWYRYSISKRRPNDIPFTPERTYKKEWKGWGDWLDTGNIAPQFRQYRPFNEAREFVRKLGLKTDTEWRKYLKSGKKPDDIPAAPWKVYNKKRVLKKK